MYGVASLRGRRAEMEDAAAARPEFLRGLHFFAVYDGHGCSHVAEACQERMHEVVAEEIAGRCFAGGDEEWTAVMERSFARVEAEMGQRRRGAAACRCKMQPPECLRVGSTAVAVVVTPDRLVVANCGDSRAVLCRGGAAFPLSSDHKPERPDELERIQAAGGRVVYWDCARVLGVLSTSRAIGDCYLKPYVTSVPEVKVVRRTTDDELLILASDGLWDVVPGGAACKAARWCLRRNGRQILPKSEGDGTGKEGVYGPNKACRDAAQLLAQLAVARQSEDNVSVVVVDLRSRTKL
ncbi:putative protein phosphatase 2C 49 [Wolffia australiana]